MKIDIMCNECKSDLEGIYEISKDTLRIKPCDTCAKEKYEEGYEDAKSSKELI